MKLFQSTVSALRIWLRRLKARLKFVKKRFINYIDRNPLRTFYAALAILVLLIIASNILGTSKQVKKEEVTVVKEVEVFSIGSVPHMKVLAKVEKSGVISVTALTPGVVQYIKTPVGTRVVKGQNLLGVSSNYQGGNTASLSRQLASVQYKNALDTKDLQHQLIAKQRNLAEKVDVNTDELRKITDLSIGETEELIALTNEILTSLDASIANLESTNVGGVNDTLILSTKQLKSQFLAVRNGARQGDRMAIYSGLGDKPPGQLSDLQKELTLKQLDLQEKMIEVNVEVARLQLSIARVVEGMMYPVSPISGVVERVSVKVGQSVNPGAELMVISGDAVNMATRVTAYIPAEIAKKISLTEESILILNGGVTVQAFPLYISREAVSGTSHGIYFLIPPEHADDTSEGGYISINLPIGYTDTTAAIPFIPIDAVYQSKDASIVFIDNGGVAESRSVQLGNVTGSFVEIKKGLSGGDQVILNRNVLAGDKVKRVTP